MEFILLYLVDQTLSFTFHIISSSSGFSMKSRKVYVSMDAHVNMVLSIYWIYM